MTGYVVRYGTAPGNYSETVDVGNTTSHTITSLPDGVRYYFAVQAYDGSRRYSAPSNEVSGITGATAPTSLSASISGSTINLAWQAPTGTVTGYRIEVGTGPGASNVATMSTGTAATYAINNVPAGTYYVRVRALDGTTTSAASNEVVATVQGGTSLDAPSNLTATVRGTLVDLAWQAASSSSTTYLVDVGTGPGIANVLTINAGTSRTYTVNGLTAGTYYFRVRGVTTGGTSATSNEVTATIGSATSSSPVPSSLTASVRGGLVDLAWQAPGVSVNGYRIEVGRGPGQNNVLATDAGTASTYTIYGLTDGTYYVRVRAWSGGSLGAASNEVIVTIGAGSSGSGGGSGGSTTPTGLAAATRNGGLVDLSWSAASGSVTGYRVEVGRGPGQSNVLATNTGAGTGYTIYGLTDGTYYIRVRAWSGGALTAASNEVVVTIGSATSGGSTTSQLPSGLTATVRNNQAVDLRWNAASGATAYRIEIGRGPGQSNVVAGDVGAGSSYTVYGMTSGTYYIRVRAWVGGVLTAPSNEVTATLW